MTCNNSYTLPQRHSQSWFADQLIRTCAGYSQFTSLMPLLKPELVVALQLCLCAQCRQRAIPIKWNCALKSQLKSVCSTFSDSDDDSLARMPRLGKSCARASKEKDKRTRVWQSCDWRSIECVFLVARLWVFSTSILCTLPRRIQIVQASGLCIRSRFTYLK